MELMQPRDHILGAVAPLFRLRKQRIRGADLLLFDGVTRINGGKQNTEQQGQHPRQNNNYSGVVAFSF